jgi:branched-chain amino acid aminotransferase
MRGAVYVNGKIAPADQAVIPVYDHGFVYGEGVYETLRTYNRVPFLFDRHIRRLRQSAHHLDLAVPFDDRTLLGWIHDTMRAAGEMREAYIRILLTRGIGELTYDIKATPTPSLVIIVKPNEEAPARVFSDGIKISLVDILRNHPRSVNPIIKSNNLLNNALAMQAAYKRGGEEALMCNYRGELSECSQSNFFMVRGGAALTPKSAAGLLEGVTRAFLFEVGREVGVEVCDETLYPEDLDSAEEAFITSTTREMSPVSRIDDRVIGAGKPGPVTMTLLEGYRRKAQELTRGVAILLSFFVLLSSVFLSQEAAPASTYSSSGGHAQIRLRSPYGLSMRATAGQILLARTYGRGKAACWRVYGWVHSSAATSSAVCGAFFSTLSRGSAVPSMTAWISARMEIKASQKRSSSSFDSLSVGSIIIVPATGNDTVGA